MANKEFSDQLKSRMDEALGYTLGKPNTPIQPVSFPDSGPSMQQNPANDQTIVTQGETKPMGEPREDLAAQNGCGQLNSETISEISSLLVSIGYILSKEGVVPDKFNTDAVLKVLTTHFQPSTPVTQEPPMETPPVEVAQTPIAEPVANLTYSNPMVNAYMESRKLLESKNAKNT